MKNPFHAAQKAIVFLLGISVLFVSQSCGDKKYKPLVVDPAFSAYVISFTSGVISNQSKITVRLVQEIATAEPGKELSSNPFSISPGIKGKAMWADKQTIEFIPDKPLPSGEIYTVEFKLSKFIDVPSDLKTLKFRFQVIKQAMLYEFEGISPYKENDAKWQRIHGSFITADYANPEALEKAVSAEKYKFTWKHSKDGKVHSFTIDSVERKSSNYFVKLKWDGDDIGAKKASDSKEIEMPALGDFKVIGVRQKNNPKTLIEVFFSDPLSKTQDMKGLFYLNPSASENVIIDGTKAQIIPSKSVTGNVQLFVYSGVKNINEKSLGKDFITTFSFVSMMPQVELIGDGVIFPSADGIKFPFRAVSLSAVDVKVIQIFENNIVQFLQVNQLDGERELKRVGRVVYTAEVPLTSDDPIDYGVWNNFALDLSTLIKPEPGAIYRVEISFRKKHSLFPCSGSDVENEEYQEPENPNKAFDETSSDYYYWSDYDDYYYDGYSWYEKDDPCKPSYYMSSDHRVSRNVFASDFGIIAKAGTNGEYVAIVTDLTTAEPLKGIEVELRNLQNQVIATGKTDGDGFCRVRIPDNNKPFVLIAKKDKARGYLRLDDGSSLSLSMFDVQGEELKKGLKGYIYGERGVWRPGDMMYLTFVLEDKNKVLPANHPVVFEFYNPMGQLSQRVVKANSLNGFYSVAVRTPGDAPTGNWTMKALVGGSTFSRTLRIETVKPNRLKINLTFPSKILKKGVTETGKLQVNWLHGAPARGCKATIEASVAPTRTNFEAFKGYVFDDPAKSFESKDIAVFNGTLNENGEATVNAKLNVEGNAPGMLAVQMKTKAFEAGGDFSIDRAMFTYSPYSQYVGVKIPEGKGWNNALYSDEKNIIPIALVDENGRPANGTVKVEIFDVYFRWWWEQSEEENLADYVSNQTSKRVKTDFVDIRNGKAMYEMNLGGNYWGRMLMRITDQSSGHSTGAVFYTTYKSWYSNAGSDNPGGAEMLMFSTDKKKYSVGEKVSIQLPVTHRGRALISLETGSKVLKNYWFEPKDQDSKFTFEVTADMAPNVYIHISYIQPHNNKNDYPIRMYGVQPISVEDPDTHLEPVITMKDELKPEETFSVTVKETKGKPMTYTIAIVDEGLLDLTRFRTPNPWDVFYNHEALGVRTWDMYKYVAGAFTGKLAGLLAVGGDAAFNKNGKENTNRFKPVVLFKGPFELKKGESKTHSFTMPNYVGSVRVMVVAGQDGAYGSAEKAVPVKQSLMVLPTLPRVVSPTETIKIPVTVFAMDKSAKNVTVNLVLDKNFEALDGTTRQLTFAQPGDQLVEFKVKVKDRIAEGKIVVNATAGGIKASSETNLQVRMPNPPVTSVVTALVKPGETWSQRINAIGIAGTNSGTVEISRMYPVNLERRLQYLIQYPHGCIEQITSAAFPQIYLKNVMDLSDARKAEIETNVNACLNRLKSYQQTNGGFAYWPGVDPSGASEWGTNYAGHFMLEAQANGYTIPVGLLDSWITYQTTQSNNWGSSKNRYSRYSDDLNQAYRLYTLALAKKPAMSAMNRMRETQGIANEARWRLAAAYAIAGKPDIAATIVNTIDETARINVDEYYYYGTYGSDERDMAMKLETLILLKRKQQAEGIVIDLAKALASDEWMSTQTTAYSLLSISKYMGNDGDNQTLACTLQIDGNKTTVSTRKPVYQADLNLNAAAGRSVSIRNTTNQDLYVRVELQGVPVMKEQAAESSNLGMSIRYFDMKGKALNPASMKQGTEFYAEVTVTHPGVRMGYTDLAIEQLFPSGWEIMNTRMDEVKSAKMNTDQPRYIDIRDDRVYMYFDLDKGKKKTFRVLLQAAYLGSFYMPSVYCQAMYDNTIRARSEGKWVEVVK